MAPHSSTLAWKIPCTEEPGRLQSMGLLRVRQDWATSLSLLTFMHWRRKWQPTPVFLPGESQRRRSLVGCRLWVPVPAGKVDQVPRTCKAGLRKETKARDYNKDGVERFRHISTNGRSLTPSFIQKSVRKTRQLTFFLGWPIHLTDSHKKSWEHGNGTLLLFLTPDNISLCVRSLHRTLGVCSK